MTRFAFRISTALTVTALAALLVGYWLGGRQHPQPAAGVGCPYQLSCPFCRGRTAFDRDPTHHENAFEHIGLEPKDEWERGWQSGLRHHQRGQADE
jgi:hypothetical protein